MPDTLSRTSWRVNELGVNEFFRVTGKTADLVLLDGNPLDDVGNTRRIHAVILAGKPFTRASLQEMLLNAARLTEQGRSASMTDRPGVTS